MAHCKLHAAWFTKLKRISFVYTRYTRVFSGLLMLPFSCGHHVEKDKTLDLFPHSLDFHIPALNTPMKSGRLARFACGPAQVITKAYVSYEREARLIRRHRNVTGRSRERLPVHSQGSRPRDVATQRHVPRMAATLLVHTCTHALSE